MSVLAIDTASPAFALAVHDRAPPPYVVESAREFSHASLLASVEKQLRGRTLEAVVAVCGPGSYSGLRVGIATAQGLALAQGCALAGLSTLEAVASAHDGLASADVALPLTAIHPAGRGQFAVQEFLGLAPVGPVETRAVGDLAGSGLAGEGAGRLSGVEIRPRERVAAALARYLAGALPLVEELAAIYLREPNITQPRRPFAVAGAEGQSPAG